MDRSYIIRELVAAGHSSTKALEVAIDAERGDRAALRWIEAIRRGAR